MRTAMVKGMVVLAAGLLALAAQAGPISGQGTWESTLQARDINNDMAIDAYYDTALDITWLADWNANGRMSWGTANTWAMNLDVHGVTGWRLPTVGPSDGAFDYAFSNNGSTDRGSAKTDIGWGTASELGHMFYVTLGNKGLCTPDDSLPGGCVLQVGFGLTNTADFLNVNVQSDYYWSGTEYGGVSDFAWLFNSGMGFQENFDKVFTLFAVAVRAGDVAGPTPVPEPGALGLLVLGGLAMALRRPR